MNSAVLITYDKDDIIKEALALCDSAGYKVEHIIKQDFLHKPKFGVSIGKKSLKANLNVVEARRQ